MKKLSRQYTVGSIQGNALLQVLACLLSATLIMGCAKKEIKNINSKGKDIICFGDSITMGYGAGLGEDYPTALGKLLNLPVINVGIDGDTTVDGLNRIETDVLSKNPLLVIIEFQGNDFIKNIPKETTFRNIKEMISRAQAKGAIVALADISAGLFLNEYRQAYYEIAKQEGVIFIPTILKGILTNPGMKSDFLHPNAKGYKIVAQRIYRAIEPYLKRNKASVNP